MTAPTQTGGWILASSTTSSGTNFIAEGAGGVANNVAEQQVATYSTLRKRRAVAYLLAYKKQPAKLNYLVFI